MPSPFLGIPLKAPALQPMNLLASSLLLAPLLLLLSSQAEATQSVFSCPLTPANIAGIPGTFPAYAATGLGEVCGEGSFLHYWTCCEDYPFECCFNLQTWAIVFLAVFAVVLVALMLCFLARYIIAQQE